MVAMDARENILFLQILEKPCLIVYPIELILIEITVYVGYNDAFLHGNHPLIHDFNNIHINFP